MLSSLAFLLNDGDRQYQQVNKYQGSWQHFAYQLSQL